MRTRERGEVNGFAESLWLAKKEMKWA